MNTLVVLFPFLFICITVPFRFRHKRRHFTRKSRKKCKNAQKSTEIWLVFIKNRLLVQQSYPRRISYNIIIGYPPLVNLPLTNWRLNNALIACVCFLNKLRPAEFGVLIIFPLHPTGLGASATFPLRPTGFEPVTSGFRKPQSKNSNPSQNQALTENGENVLASCLALLTPKYPDLALVVKSWQDLPEHIKQANKTFLLAGK